MQGLTSPGSLVTWKTAGSAAGVRGTHTSTPPAEQPLPKSHGTPRRASWWLARGHTAPGAEPPWGTLLPSCSPEHHIQGCQEVGWEASHPDRLRGSPIWYRNLHGAKDTSGTSTAHWGLIQSKERAKGTGNAPLDFRLAEPPESSWKGRRR